MGMNNNWQPIETAPHGYPELLFWWRPIDGNKHAECCTIGVLLDDPPNTWWNGRAGEYQDVWHLTHWMPAPKRPPTTTGRAPESLPVTYSREAIYFDHD